MTTIYLLTLGWAGGLIAKRIYDRRIDLVLGLHFGTAYFVLVPMGLLFIQGRLETPKLTSIPGIGNIILRSCERQVTALLFMVLCTLLFAWAISLLDDPPEQDARLARIFSDVLFAAALVLYLGTASFLFVKGGLATGGHWSKAQGAVFESLGSVGIFIGATSFAAKALLLCILCGWFLEDRVGLLRLLGTLAVLCVFDLYVTSTRIFTLQTMLLVSSILAVKRRYQALALFILVLYPLGALMNLFAMVRPFMHLSGLTFEGVVKGYEFARQHHVSGGVSGFIMGVTEGADFMVLLETLRVFPKAHPFLEGATIGKIFLIGIPRAVWPHKPINITRELADIFVGRSDTSLAVTIYGEFYANFGVLAILAIPVAMMLVQRLVYWSTGRSSLSAPLSLLYGFTFTRMAFSDTLIPVLLIGIMVYGIAIAVRTFECATCSESRSVIRVNRT